MIKSLSSTFLFAVLLIGYINCDEPTSSPSLSSGVGNSSESVELDFINLPGYGIIDDENTTFSGNFSCYGHHYGYYADISKNCSMFHLCYPTADQVSGDVTYQRFSFFCSENGTFDQMNLVCVDNNSVTINCQESYQYFEQSNIRLVETLQRSNPGYFADATEEAANDGGGGVGDEASNEGNTGNAQKRQGNANTSS